uniref:Uncharacterized protein n=1 Tax=Nelumbo nucifera TaxID=4432 RepID=A0A822YXI0_NELNU|nr:TPA_asm: hypothetical protein HUJ06_006096 [Nelumbo nucifera]
MQCGSPDSALRITQESATAEPVFAVLLLFLVLEGLSPSGFTCIYKKNPSPATPPPSEPTTRINQLSPVETVVVNLHLSFAM